MISFIRKWLTSWPVLILLGLVLIAFAVTGVGDPFNRGGGPQGSVASVGGAAVTEAQLMQRIDRVVRDAKARDPGVTQVQLAQQGGVPLIAEQLIGAAALDQLAVRAGLTASDRALGAEIGGIAAFQRDGKFDDATYRRVLGENRMTDRDLRTSVTGDIVRKQLLTPLIAALQVPRGLAEPYARLLADVHKGAAAIVPLAAAPPPSDAEIAAYYATSTSRFTLPERRAFRYAMIDRAVVAATVRVTDAEIAAAFAKDKAKYGGEATRTLSQAVVSDEAKARAIAAAARTEGFAAAAQRIAGLAAADTGLGAQTQGAFGAATSPAVAAAAFALPAGGVTAPIKSDFGWHVVKVEAIGGAGKTIDAARPQIAADLARVATDKALSELVARIEDGAEAGKSFADLAKANGLVIQTAPPVTKQGRTGADAASALPAPLLPLAAKAFGHEPADGIAVEDLGGGNLAAIETVQVLPPAPQPLATVRAEVVAAVSRDKALKAAKIKADAVVAAVKAGTPFATAVAAQGLKPPQPLLGRRIDVQNQPNAPQIILAFLDTPARSVRALQGSAGWVLLHVDSIAPGDAAALPPIAESKRRDMAAQGPDEFSLAFAAAAGTTVGVRRNPAAIDAISRRLSGAADPQ